MRVGDSALQKEFSAGPQAPARAIWLARWVTAPADPVCPPATIRFSRLLGELALARADDSYTKLLARLAKAHLLVLDDFWLSPLTDTERHGYIIAH